MASRKLPIDPVTVQAGLRRQGLLRRDGYPTMELVRMVESSITSLYFCSSEPRFSCGRRWHPPSRSDSSTTQGCCLTET